MKGDVSLRPVELGDLPIFFTHQLDPEATRLAAFPSRAHEAFMDHWTTKVLGIPANASRTILFENVVAGYLGAWTDAESGQRQICYWIGREFWGRGIATAAVVLFLQSESTRPVYARVAKHNLGSIRVLEKSGFTRSSEDTLAPADGTHVAEFVYVRSD